MFHCLCRLAFFAVPHSHPLYPAARLETSKALTVVLPGPSKRLMSASLVVPGLPGLRSQAAFVHLQFVSVSWGSPTSGSSTCLLLLKWLLSIVLYGDLFWLLVIGLLSKSKISSTQGKNKLITFPRRGIHIRALQRRGVNWCTLVSLYPLLPFFAWLAFFFLSCHLTPLSD